MKINNITVLVSNIEKKINNNTKEPYWSIGVLDLSDGTNFNLTVKEEDKANKLKMMNKYIMDFTLQDSKYGMKLSLDNVGKELGGIV
ncbi:MAG: hypothetical protein ACLRVF_18395 [Clostridium paraputrificum]